MPLFIKPKGKVTSLYKYRGSVPTYNSLPTQHTVGDVYNVEIYTATDGTIYTGVNFAWNGVIWDNLSGTIPMATNADYATGTDTIKRTSIAGIVYGFKYWIENVSFSSLTTTQKTVVGAINEIKNSTFMHLQGNEVKDGRLDVLRQLKAGVLIAESLDVGSNKYISASFEFFSILILTLNGSDGYLRLAGFEIGGFYTVVIKQDSVGGRTTPWETNVHFENGIPPILATAPGAIDIFYFIALSATDIYCIKHSTNF